MSVVTLMRWHVELKRDITEYVLTLRRWSWNYDVRLDIMMLMYCLKHEQQCFIGFKNTRRSRVFLNPIKHVLRVF